MQRKYSRITQIERDEIAAGLSAGESEAEIARLLGRPTSAVSREVNNSGGRKSYRPSLAGRRAKLSAASRRRGRTKMSGRPRLRREVERMLRKRLSPDQISERLAMEYPDDMTMRISPEAIYQYIYVLPRGELKAALVKGLRQERKRRRKRRKAGDPEETRGKIAEMLSIEERPAEVADRTVPGHWEGDLIVGLHRASAVATLVERVTRFTIIIKLDAKDATTVRKAMARAVSRLPMELRKSLTYDQGKEMSGHRLFASATGMKVYFAHPASPWERGTNENTNGLIRQYFPKGTDFRKVTAREIRKCQDSLNARPRKVLGYYTPAETFGELMNRCVKF
ncbi:MAG: IS30 family transposase [Patescibacteria group bacterium]